jgi:uncharacterized protein (TIGR03067 family)
MLLRALLLTTALLAIADAGARSSDLSPKRQRGTPSPSLALRAKKAGAAFLSARVEEAAADLTAQDKKKLQGTWTVAAHTTSGTATPAKKLTGWRLTVAGDKMTTRDGTDVLDESTFRLDAAGKPRAIDLRLTEGPDKGKSVQGIYKLEGDTLTVCVAEPGRPRPRELASRAGSGHMLFVFKRAKK